MRVISEVLFDNPDLRLLNMPSQPALSTLVRKKEIRVLPTYFAEPEIALYSCRVLYFATCRIYGSMQEGLQCWYEHAKNIVTRA